MMTKENECYYDGLITGAHVALRRVGIEWQKSLDIVKEVGCIPFYFHSEDEMLEDREYVDILVTEAYKRDVEFNKMLALVEIKMNSNMDSLREAGLVDPFVSECGKSLRDWHLQVLTEINVCTDAKRGMSVEKIAKNRWLTEAQVRAIIRDNPTLFDGNEKYLRRNAIDQMRRHINDFEYLFQNYGKEVINQMRAQVDELEKLFEEHDRDADE
jgi:hypothetical protein